MKCSQCSVEIPADSAFCNRCGASQGEERPARPFVRGEGAQAPEETLWSGRYSVRGVAHLWCLSAGLSTLALWQYPRVVAAAGPRVGLAFLCLGLLPPVWVLALFCLRRFTMRYRLTNHRLFVERGLFTVQHDELELIRVDDVSVRRNLFQRVFDTGTVTVLSTDTSNPELRIQGIAAPLKLKELIRSVVRMRRSRTTFLETL